MKLYCLLDLDTSKRGPIFEAENDRVALRSLQDVKLPGGSECWALFYLGDLAQDELHIVPLTEPCNVPWPVRPAAILPEVRNGTI